MRDARTGPPVTPPRRAAQPRSIRRPPACDLTPANATLPLTRARLAPQNGERPQGAQDVLRPVQEAHVPQGQPVQGGQGVQLRPGPAALRPEAAGLRRSDQARVPQEGASRKERASASEDDDCVEAAQTLRLRLWADRRHVGGDAAPLRTGDDNGGITTAHRRTWVDVDSTLATRRRGSSLPRDQRAATRGAARLLGCCLEAPGRHVDVGINGDAAAGGAVA